MKRTTLILAALVSAILVLAACSNESGGGASAAGDWEGTAQGNGGVTVPVSFTIDAQGRVNASSLDISYEDHHFSFSVVSEVTETSLFFSATATHDHLGNVQLVVEGDISGDTITGTFEFSASNGEDTLVISGTFTATRQSS